MNNESKAGYRQSSYTDDPSQSHDGISNFPRGDLQGKRINISATPLVEPNQDQPIVTGGMDETGGDFTPELNNGKRSDLQNFNDYAMRQSPGKDLMDMSMGSMEQAPNDVNHIVLQNGGYGNIVYNIMFLLQIRITKYFQGGKLNVSHNFFQRISTMNSFANIFSSYLRC